MNKVETIILIAVLLFAAFYLIPSFYETNKSDCSSNGVDAEEKFTAMQKTGASDAPGYDPDAPVDGSLKPKGPSQNYESLIYDNVTGTIMSGSQFMENTGIIAPPWVAPAWDPDAYGPSSKGEMDPADYENDPRMLYNKCSLSCCSPQYPTPFLGSADPFVCDKNGNSKYLASNYLCTNNTGGSGCLCMTQKQVDGMFTGFVDYYVDKDKLGY